MEIVNLEVNILYFLCSPIDGSKTPGVVDRKAVIREFSDIPERNIASAVAAMVGAGLVTVDPEGSPIRVTDRGIEHLQASIACRVHQFTPCRCGLSG